MLLVCTVCKYSRVGIHTGSMYASMSKHVRGAAARRGKMHVDVSMFRLARHCTAGYVHLWPVACGLHGASGSL